MLESYRTEGGDYKLPNDECSYQTVEDLIGTGLLSFCGCGRPEDAIRYVLDGLDLIAEQRPDPLRNREAWNAWYNDHKVREVAHFKTDGAAYFFWYWADNEQLIEHGGSVPGWLTAHGEHVVALLREWRDSNEPGGEPR